MVNGVRPKNRNYRDGDGKQKVLDSFCTTVPCFFDLQGSCIDSVIAPNPKCA